MAKTTAKKSAPAKKAADVKKPAAKKAATPKVTAPAKRPKLKLPPEGIYVGSGIYPTDTDTLLCTMIGHYTWQAQHFDVLEQIEKIIDDNQGNLAQVWGIARGFSPKLITDWFYALDEIGIDISPWRALKIFLRSTRTASAPDLSVSSVKQKNAASIPA